MCMIEENITGRRINEKMNSLNRDDILPAVFLYLKIFGVWQPTNCSKVFSAFYRIYTVIIVVSYGTMLLMEILNIAFAEENRFETFQEHMYLILTHTNLYVKMINFIVRRDKVVMLIDSCLTRNWNPPRDDEEWKILNKYNRASRITTTLLALTIACCILLYIFDPLAATPKTLPYDAWYPCDLNTSVCFWLAYSHQGVISIPAGLIMVANDCLIAGFMMQISVQLNVLSYRLLNIPEKLKIISHDGITHYERESYFIRECIESHNQILRLAELLSKTFIEIVFIQFCVTLSVICTTVFFLVQIDPFSFEFIAAFLYFEGMLVQFFYYCWYGNEVMINSNQVFQTVFEMDWTSLNRTSNKALLIMMTVAVSSIELFKGVIIKVNLDSFINILKLSYSAFNVLKNTL